MATVSRSRSGKRIWDYFQREGIHTENIVNTVYLLTIANVNAYVDIQYRGAV
jgi:hypothetical protein